MESTSYTVNAQGQRNDDVVADPATLKACPSQSSTEVERIASAVPLPGSPATIDAKANGSEAQVEPAKPEQGVAEKPVRVGLLSTPVRPDVSKFLKMDAAHKQSMADKTGNSLLRIQARAEQSIADKLGGRRAMTTKSAEVFAIPAVQSEIAQISSELAALKMNAAYKRSIADRLGDANLRREAQIAQSIADKMGARKAMLQSGKIAQQQGRAFVDQVNKQKLRPPTTTAAAAAPQQSLSPKSALKLTAAVTRSIADRLDNPALREEARKKQSLADKAGARRALLQTGPVTKLAAAPVAPNRGVRKPLLPKPVAAAPALVPAVAGEPLTDSHPRTIDCLGCRASFPMSPDAVGPSLSTHLKEFPDHQKKRDEVPEKDRVYIAKENYKGRFDHNFADPLNFAPVAVDVLAKVETPIIPAVTAANAAL